MESILSRWLFYNAIIQEALYHLFPVTYIYIIMSTTSNATHVSQTLNYGGHIIKLHVY
jgi:hypothetical protein